MKLRILYRGHVSGQWVPPWAIEADTGHVVFATRDPHLASKENARIQRIEIDHIDSKVLREGSKPFERITRACADCRTPRDRTDRVVAIAEREGWDVVWFRSADVGVAIVNPSVIVNEGWIVV